MDGYTEKLLRSAEDLLKQGWIPRAVALFETAVKQVPDDNQVQLRVATAYERHGALPEAAKAYARLAVLFETHGRPEKAEQLRRHASEVREMFEAMVDVDLTPIGKAVRQATLIFRAPAPRAAGFLAFCLGVMVAIAPVAAPEVGDALSGVKAMPSLENSGLDGRTRGALGLLGEDGSTASAGRSVPDGG